MSIYDKKYQYMLCPIVNSKKFIKFKKYIEKQIPSIVYKKIFEATDGSTLLFYEKEEKELVLVNDYKLDEIVLYSDINLNEYIKPYKLRVLEDKMDLRLEKYKKEYEKVKNIRHWSDSYTSHCFHNGKETKYIKPYLDDSDRIEYCYKSNGILFKKEFSFKGKVFKIRYYDDKGNITKVENTEYYKPEYESLDCLHLPFEQVDLMIYREMYEDEKSECEKMEKENEEEKRYFEGLNK